MDLPVWQGLYSELRERRFVPIAVAFESRGAEAARPWIEGAAATYPCLVDEHHLVAELYGMVNVPNAVWINEDGIIVRPPEAAGTADAFRTMDRVNFSVPEDARVQLQQARGAYLNALRDWVANGAESRFALSAADVRRRLAPVTDGQARAAASFRLGEHLAKQGDLVAARRWFDAALELHPESWAMRRQAWNLEEATKSGGPEFWAAVDALGEKPYYPPVSDIVGTRP